MVFFLVGPALLLSSLLVFLIRKKDANGQPKPRNWPVIWLLFWLGIFFIRLWAFILSFILMVAPIPGPGKLRLARKAFNMYSSVRQSGDGGSTKHGALFQLLVLLVIAIGGFHGLKYLLNELARRRGDTAVPFP